MTFEKVLQELEGSGLLMLSDKALPSVVGIVGGGKIKGSWWGHEKGHKIFWDLKKLEAHPDVMTTRLVSSKVTYLHRKLWREFLSIALARQKWQTLGLSQAARRLLSSVSSYSEVRMDRYGSGSRSGKYRDAAREIERRLLVYGEEFHTETGAHAKILMTWSRCPKLIGQHISLKSPEASRKVLEALVDGLNAKFEGKGTLPWRQ